MLRAATVGVSGRGYVVSALSRRERRLERVVAEAPGEVDTYSLDYREADALTEAIDTATAARGAVTMVLAWIHGSATEAPLAIARQVAKGRTIRYLHVRGSAAADPSNKGAGPRAAFEGLPGICYEEIILGFVRGRSRARWLTHSEISAGVLGVVDAPALRTIVGVVSPWDARP